MKRARDPTPEQFEKLLAWLDSDRDDAGRKFQLIHSRLSRIFAARGCSDVESLADEVINRIAVRIDTVIEKYTEPFGCCLAFVQNVYREYSREQQQQANPFEPPAPRPPEELEKEDECLKHCLDTLTQPQRDLFVRYFQSEKRAKINARKKLAAELVLTANALRLRAHHLRKEMHQCLVTCLNQS